MTLQRIEGYELGYETVESFINFPMGRAMVASDEPMLLLRVEGGKQFRMYKLEPEVFEMFHTLSCRKGHRYVPDEYRILQDSTKMGLDPFDPIEFVYVATRTGENGCQMNQKEVIYEKTGKRVHVVHCEADDFGNKRCKATVFLKDGSRRNVHVPSSFVMGAMYNTDVILNGRKLQNHSLGRFLCAGAAGVMVDDEEHTSAFVGIGNEIGLFFLDGYDYRTKMPRPRLNIDPRYRVSEFVCERNRRKRDEGIKTVVERVEIDSYHGDRGTIQAHVYMGGRKEEGYQFVPSHALLLAELLDMRECYIDDVLFDLQETNKEEEK